MIDILLFGLLAGFVAYRLYAALGNKDDETIQRANKKACMVPGDNYPIPNKKIKTIEALEIDTQNIEVVSKDTPAAAAEIIQNLHKLNPEFTEKFFLEGARIAFESIVSAFNKCDVNALQDLLAPEILKQFTEVIENTKSSKRFPNTTIISIKECILCGGKMDKNVATLDIKITSEQINIVKNEKNEIIEGDPHAVENTSEIWSFTRDTNAKDPNWRLFAIRDIEHG